MNDFTQAPENSGCGSLILNNRIMQTGGLILLIMAVLTLVIYLFQQNMKDRKKLTDQLNRDYRKSKEEEGDINIDEIKH